MEMDFMISAGGHVSLCVSCKMVSIQEVFNVSSSIDMGADFIWQHRTI
jgi:hypothetical protein